MGRRTPPPMSKAKKQLEIINNDLGCCGDEPPAVFVPDDWDWKDGPPPGMRFGVQKAPSAKQ